MPRAVRPLFVAAVLLLLGAVAVLGVRTTGDGDPTALPEPTPAPTDEVVVPSPTGDDEPGGGLGDDEDDGDDGDDGDGGDGVTGGGDDDGTTDDSEGTDGDGTAGDRTTDDSEGTDGDGTAGDGTTDDGEGTDGDGTAGGGDRPLDDMPETGGGATTALAGLVALGAAAGMLRRR